MMLNKILIRWFWVDVTTKAQFCRESSSFYERVGERWMQYDTVRLSWLY